MIDSVLNLLFNCPHRHLTRPFTPVSKSGVAHSETYVVCLDCAKQFPYDLNTMRMGRAIDHTHDHYVVLPNLASPRKTKVKYAIGIGVPLGVLIGSLFAARKTRQEARETKQEKEAKEAKEAKETKQEKDAKG